MRRAGSRGAAPKAVLPRGNRGGQTHSSERDSSPSARSPRRPSHGSGSPRVASPRHAQGTSAAAGDDSAKSGRSTSTGGEGETAAAPRRGRSPRTSKTVGAPAANKDRSPSTGRAARGTSARRRDVTTPTEKRLSFVIDCTLEQVRFAIASEDPNWNFNDVFWTALLTGQPCFGFKSLQNRTLTFWTACFNKWQRLGFPAFVDGTHLRSVVFTSETHLCSIVKLFDSEKAARLLVEGLSHRLMSKTQVPMLELITAGVMLTRLMSTKHKLKFLFGLVDVEDRGALDVNGLAAFLRAFTHGLGAVYGVPQALMPNDASIRNVAGRLYERILVVAGLRVPVVRDRVDGGTAEVCVSCDAAGGASLAGVSSGDGSACPAVASAVQHESSPSTAEAASVEGGQHTLPSVAGFSHGGQDSDEGPLLSFDTFQDWFYGSLSDEDPFALPYRLSIERQCPTRHGDIADEFDIALAGFSLSHQSEVPIPKEVSSTHSTLLLTRAEVLLARDIFKYARDLGRIRLDTDELRALCQKSGRSLEEHQEERFLDSLAKLVEAHCVPGGGIDHIDFFDYLRALCPPAHPKHLRMFDVWCDEFDAHVVEKAELEKMEDAARSFVENERKPILPAEERSSLERQFKTLDCEGKGWISVDDLMKWWQLSDDEALSIFPKFDIARDDTIDMEEFLRITCPEEYRLPEMSGFARASFGNLLLASTLQKRDRVQDKASLYLLHSDGTSPQSGNSVAMAAPSSMLPVAPEDVISQWNDVFNDLDRDDDDLVRVRDLEASGLLSTAVCYCVASLIEPVRDGGFSREAFVAAMCRAHQYRLKGSRVACLDGGSTASN
eukprot:TRINITY_DN15318_c1_g1_i1.p1 TRINITY_DN15318_c1_g1~~TRINITY_DN15318_c1_g1_i1.p1  ORF type:complete len:835 (-),score=129.10 TRINITY_DN15318_c1_g1_i1:21-2525(-)